jgi:phosphate-selective porin OprO/OprP
VVEFKIINRSDSGRICFLLHVAYRPTIECPMIRLLEYLIVGPAVVLAMFFVFLACTISPLSAQESPPGTQKADQTIVKWQPAPLIESVDGEHSIKLRGRLHWDAAWIDDDDGVVDIDDTEFRAARVGIEGKAFKSLRYRLEIDFAGGGFSIKDGWVLFDAGPAEIKIGQFKLAPSLEEATSSQYITFMERASFTDAFGFARQIGVSIKTSGETWQFQAGAFRGAATDDNKDDGTTVAARASVGPKIGDLQLHFGAAIRYRDRDSEHSDLSYSQRPHQHLSEKFVSTGRIAESDIFYGFEAAAMTGPFSLQGEWGWLDANLSDSFLASNPSLSDPSFNGGYISASYFLSGESRPYKASSGGFSRIKVKNPLHKGGLGAWELGIRIDRIDLSDNGISGGEQDLIVAGLNWYPNRYMRLMLNFARAEIKSAFLVPGLNGADGKNDVNSFGLRAQVNW